MFEPFVGAFVETVVVIAHFESVQTGSMPDFPEVRGVVQVPENSISANILSLLDAGAFTLNQMVITTKDIGDPKSFTPELAAHEARHAQQQVDDPHFMANYFGEQIAVNFQHDANRFEADGILFGAVVGPALPSGYVKFYDPWDNYYPSISWYDSYYDPIAAGF